MKKYLPAHLAQLNRGMNLVNQTNHIPQEEVNSNAHNYYNEMNKIFQLCLEKLSGDKLEVLRTTQQKWQDQYDQRLSEYLSEHNANNMKDLVDQSMYYQLWGMMLKEIFYLINLYYDNHFYI